MPTMAPHIAHRAGGETTKNSAASALLQATSGGSGQALLAAFIALKDDAAQQDLTLVTN